MRRENSVTVGMLNDIIIHKLTGILNKLETATDQDARHLQEELRAILRNQQTIAADMQSREQRLS